MSATTVRWVRCDAPGGCVETVRGRAGQHNPSDIREVRTEAKRLGWTHPDGYTDLCPLHSRPADAKDPS